MSGENSSAIGGSDLDTSDFVSDNVSADSLEAFARRISTETGVGYQDILDDLEYTANQRADIRVGASQKDSFQKNRLKALTGWGDNKPGSFFTGESGHPMLIEAAELAKEKMKFEDSMLKDLIDIKNGNFHGSAMGTQTKI